MTSISEAEVDAYLAELSHHEGRSAPVVTWVDGGGSQVRPGRVNHLELDRRILSDRDDARFTVAHEFGHIALGHTSGRRNGSLIGIYAGTGMAAMVAAAVLVNAVLGSGAAPIGLFIGALGWVWIQRQLSLRLKRPMEHAADLYAARVGAPLTAALVERYEAERTPTSRFLSYLFPLHPSWAERATVTAAAFPATRTCDHDTDSDVDPRPFRPD